MKLFIAPQIGFLLFLTGFIGFPAAAVNWKMISDDEKVRVEIDVATLVRDGNTAKAWERTTYRKPEQAYPGDFFFTSEKSLAQYHCSERTTTYLFRGFFAADGSEIKTIVSGADLGKVDFLVPDSLEERKLVFACAYKDGIKKPGISLPQPETTEKTAEPPPPTAKAEHPPAKPIEKSPQKDATPAKSAVTDKKSPVALKPENETQTKQTQTKPVATTHSSSKSPGKAPSVK